MFGMTARRTGHLLAHGLLAFLALAAGCSDDNDDNDDNQPTIPPTPVSESRFWVGTLDDDASQDAWQLALALDREDDALTGQLVLYHPDQDMSQVLKVLGTLTDDAADLEVDPVHGTDPEEFTCQLSGWGGPLSGTLTMDWTSTSGTVAAREVPRGRLVERAAQEHDEDFESLVYDGQQRWLPTFGEGWHRYDDDGQHLGTTEVALYPEAYWTSPHVAWDGTNLHGSYPVGLQGDDGVINVSDIVTFTPEGVVVSRTTLSHRVRGLAWDGDAFLTLAQGAGRLHRVGVDGQDLASTPLELSDLAHLDLVGSRVFAQGWFMPHVFELDLDGELVAVHDYPDGRDVVLARGLTHVDAGHLLCGVQLRGGQNVVLELEVPGRRGG